MCKTCPCTICYKLTGHFIGYTDNCLLNHFEHDMAGAIRADVTASLLDFHDQPSLRFTEKSAREQSEKIDFCARGLEEDVLTDTSLKKSLLNLEEDGLQQQKTRRVVAPVSYEQESEGSRTLVKHCLV